MTTEKPITVTVKLDVDAAAVLRTIRLGRRVDPPGPPPLLLGLFAGEQFDRALAKAHALLTGYPHAPTEADA